MIRHTKIADERREAGPVECWLLHGAVGSAADWRPLAKSLTSAGIGTRAVDLWRFLDCAPMPLDAFGEALTAEAGGEVFRGSGRVLIGYSMGGRLALHTLLADPSPWQAAIIVSAHPGLESPEARGERLAADTAWATRALTGDWPAFLAAWNAQPVLAGNAFDGDDAPRASRLMLRRREIARSFVDWSLGAQQPLWPRLAAIQTPTLWITGTDDPKFTDLARRAASSMPKAAHLAIPNAGHRVPWQAPSAFQAAITRFLHTADLP